jgi:hypothetical protein
MPTERTLECDLKTEVDFVMPAKQTLECDLKTEVDFVPHGADFGCDYNSRLCAMRGGLKMQKTKSPFWKAKAKKSEKTSSLSLERA